MKTPDPIAPPSAPWWLWLVVTSGDDTIPMLHVGAAQVRRWVEQGARSIALVGIDEEMACVHQANALRWRGCDERPLLSPDGGTVVFNTGATATTYGSDEPEDLIDAQHDHVWCHNLSSWRDEHVDLMWERLRTAQRFSGQVLVTSSLEPADSPGGRMLARWIDEAENPRDRLVTEVDDDHPAYGLRIHADRGKFVTRLEAL